MMFQSASDFPMYMFVGLPQSRCVYIFLEYFSSLFSLPQQKKTNVFHLRNSFFRFFVCDIFIRSSQNCNEHFSEISAFIYLLPTKLSLGPVVLFPLLLLLLLCFCPQISAQNWLNQLPFEDYSRLFSGDVSNKPWSIWIPIKRKWIENGSMHTYWTTVLSIDCIIIQRNGMRNSRFASACNNRK